MDRQVFDEFPNTKLAPGWGISNPIYYSLWSIPESPSLRTLGNLVKVEATQPYDLVIRRPGIYPGEALKHKYKEMYMEVFIAPLFEVAEITGNSLSIIRGMDKEK